MMQRGWLIYWQGAGLRGLCWCLLCCVPWWPSEPRPGHLLDKLRLVVTSGEALEAELANLFQSAMPDARLLNFYGSSEVAADATWCTVSRRKASDPILIGRPWITYAHLC